MKLETNEDKALELSELYTGLAIKTGNGVFHLCERDGGLEIRFGEGEWYAWYDANGPVIMRGQVEQ